jgi:hypothetical protein
VTGVFRRPMAPPPGLRRGGAGSSPAKWEGVGACFGRRRLQSSARCASSPNRCRSTTS